IVLTAIGWGDKSGADSPPAREETGPFSTFYTLHPVEEASMAKKAKKAKKVIVMVEVDPDQGITIPKFKAIPLGQKLAKPVSYGASPAATDSAAILATMTCRVTAGVCASDMDTVS